MSNEKYDVVFTGELVRSFELAAVKKNIGQLFKIKGDKLEALFSGQFVVLKRNLDFDTAAKYRTAIKRAGARVDLIPVEPPVNEMELRRSRGKAVFRVADDDSEHEGVGESAITLAPAGADVLNASERKAAVVADIEIPALSLKEAVGDILDPHEKRPVETPPESAIHQGFDLAPVGDDLLKASERQEVEYLEIDLSGLSVARLGERLSEPSPEPPSPPDVSGFSLENSN